ncbi:hypothetical protein LCGC14_2713350 [marine sediment metagenome]|uniref:Uncharacterized protein n=1 Tax=marine sediment metagenome TaxID=412755 RepID=A0A0F8ZC79_9ZZZZ
MTEKDHSSKYHYCAECLLDKAPGMKTWVETHGGKEDEGLPHVYNDDNASAKAGRCQNYIGCGWGLSKEGAMFPLCPDGLCWLCCARDLRQMSGYEDIHVPPCIEYALLMQEVKGVSG